MSNSITTSPAPVSRRQREVLLGELQPKVLAASVRRRRLRGTRGISVALMVIVGLLVWTNQFTSTTPEAELSKSAPTNSGPPPVATILVGNRPQLAREVVVCNDQVDKTNLEFSNVSDDELLALVDTGDQPISVARIDNRLVVIAVRDSGEKDPIPVPEASGPALN